MLPLQQLIDLGLAQDQDSLRKELTRAAADLGFGLFSAVLIRGSLDSGNAWLAGIGNMAPEYSAAMNSLDDALRDPVMTALRSSVAPVQYDQATYVDAGVADLWDMQAAFGYRCGVACSVHQASHLEQFMLGIDGDSLPKDPIARLELTSAVQLLTVHAQAAMQRIHTPAASGSPALEDEELECLRWARDGLTVWQIGDRLAISNRQVGFRQQQAARKLGTHSVHGAVLRCIEGGMID